jgi:hypothetical protein
MLTNFELKSRADTRSRESFWDVNSLRWIKLFIACTRPMSSPSL